MIFGVESKVKYTKMDGKQKIWPGVLKKVSSPLKDMLVTKKLIFFILKRIKSFIRFFSF